MVCKPVMDINRDRYDAVLFDLDGVVTKTAKVHAASWKKLFDEYLKNRAGGEDGSWAPFDINSDYNAYVDGKPRYDGVKSFLKSRGIDLVFGSPDDSPDAETICGLGNRKNQIFNDHLQTHGVEPYDIAVELLRVLKENGFKTAVVSSSKNCRTVITVAGIEELFDTRVDGVVSAQLGLDGKPNPDIFLEAARQLGVPPERAIVLEDAISGVQAGRRGQFGCVIGVDRIGHAQALKENGANVVVRTFAELTVAGKRPAAGRNMDQLVSALESMEEIRGLLTGKRPFIALDYDGTLTPIVERPDLAILSDEMRGTVKTLANQCTVAVISGRDLDDVKGLVGIDSLFYAGSHGFDISGPAGRWIDSQQGAEFLPALDRAEKSLRSLEGDVPGVLVERKKFSIAIHYRQVEKSRVQAVEAAVDQVLAEQAGLRKASGKKIFELQPDIDWHKGKALGWLMEALDLYDSDVLPFYIGDDITDEDAFRVLQGCGVGVIVKDDESGETPKRSAARYALDDCRQVREFLENLSSILQGESR
jgi:trehalose 6-phosphate phosphatase